MAENKEMMSTPQETQKFGDISNVA
jgi:hypothetical protein